MSDKASITTPLKRARGLGAAHDGTHHFWVQRLTALALIPLTIWFMTSFVVNIIDHDIGAVHAWLHSPITAMLLAALMIALFWHAKLGLQVIIEDYVHSEGKKIFTLLFTNILIYGFGAAALMAIAQLHFFAK
jgi:succinate dehydrogenase / fumarate reductase, membrane anchor subunit